MLIPVQGSPDRIELLLCVPGTRGLSACWLDGDGIFGVGGFPIDFVSKGAVHLPVYVNTQKWEVTTSFYFYSELYVVVNPIEVV